MAVSNSAFSQSEIDSIKVFKNMHKGGSTAKFGIMLKFPHNYQKTPEFIVVEKKDVEIFSQILSKSKSKVHFQKKMWVELGLIVYANNEAFYYVVESPRWIGDLYGKRYKVVNEAHQQKMESFINKYK